MEAGNDILRLIPGLAVELARMDVLLMRQFVRMRTRGRTALGEAIGGAVIEEGEAEGLLKSLQDSHVVSTGRVPMPEHNSSLEPLERARKLYGLHPIERDLLLLALSVEIDVRYARVVGFLNDHVSMTRPTLGLALSVLEADHEPKRSALLARLVNDGPLQRFGLIELPGESPLATRPLQVPSGFWPRLIGLSAALPLPIHSLEQENSNRLELPDGLRQRVCEAQQWGKRQRPEDILVLITGKEESGREALAKSVLSDWCRNAIIVAGSSIDQKEKLSLLEREARAPMRREDPKVSAERATGSCRR